MSGRMMACMVVAITLATALVPIPRAAPQGGPGAGGTTRTRMGRHAVGLTGLGQAVVLLDFPTTARLARQIADDETLALGLRPAGERAGEPFAALQEELRARARTLADRAAERDDSGVADSFGELAKTCVHCHRLYLRPGPRTGP